MSAIKNATRLKVYHMHDLQCKFLGSQDGPWCQWDYLIGSPHFIITCGAFQILIMTFPSCCSPSQLGKTIHEIYLYQNKHDSEL